MHRILIADNSEEFVQQLCKQLSGRYELCACRDGDSALTMVTEFQPDVLILDLQMPVLDGISVLRALHYRGQMPKVLVTTACIYSDYVLQTLVQMGVQYALPKPCTVNAVVEYIREMTAGTEDEAPCPSEQIDRLLLTMGMRMSLSGFACTRAALSAMLMYPDAPITKVIYPEAAKLCGGNAKRTERAIRIAIADAWKHRSESVWRLYFAPGREGKVECPTNNQFLSRMIGCLKGQKAV